MPFSGSGVYTRPSNSFSNPVTGTVISPVDADSTFDDFETAFNTVLTKATLSRVSTQLDVTGTTTLTNVPGLAVNLAASHLYSFDIVIFTTSLGAGGIRFGVSGTATANSFIVEAHTFSANSIAQRVRADEFPSVSPLVNVTGVNAAFVHMLGVIDVNALGTFRMQFAQSAANGTASSVLVNSYMCFTDHS